MELLGRQPGAGHSRADLTDLPVNHFWPVQCYLITYLPRRYPTITNSSGAAQDAGRREYIAVDSAVRIRDTNWQALLAGVRDVNRQNTAVRSAS